MNIPGDESHGKSVSELVKYVVEGKLESDHDSDLTRLDEIVNLVKKKPEVSRAFMREWDRQRIHDRELTEQVTKQVTDEVKEDLAIKLIIRSHQRGVSEETIKEDLKEDYGFSDDLITKLIKKAGF